MSEPHVANSFDSKAKLGVVSALDTLTVQISATNEELLRRATVGTLIAIQTGAPGQFLIALTDRVTRKVRDAEALSLDSSDDGLADEQPDDAVRVILVGTYRKSESAEKRAFKRGIDRFPQVDSECFLMEGEALQEFMGLFASQVSSEHSLDLGHFLMDPSARVVAHGDRFFQRHAALLGSTGSGKSWAVSLLLERAAKLKHANLIVFDLHGEYGPLTERRSTPTGEARPMATGFRIAGSGDLDAPDDNVLFLPYWLLSREEMISMIVDRSDQNAPNQASRFTHWVHDLKRAALSNAGHADTLASFTVDSPIPYSLEDLLQRLKEDNTRKGEGKNGPVKGEWENLLTRFISRLETKTQDRRYGFLFAPPPEATQYEWLAQQCVRLLRAPAGEPGIKIIDFSEVPSDVLPVVTAILARLLYNVQFWMDPDVRTPFTLVCDEAHLYLPKRDGAGAVEKQALETFERIAKEGRKRGVSLLVVSQRPSDVSTTILSQCNNFIALRLTNETDQGVVRRLVPDSFGSLLDGLSLLDVGEALLLGDAVLLPTRVKLDKPTIEPRSHTRDFWQEWGSRQPDEAAIADAVEALRRQTRQKRAVAPSSDAPAPSRVQPTAFQDGDSGTGRSARRRRTPGDNGGT